jgi:hypothetical protein
MMPENNETLIAAHVVESDSDLFGFLSVSNGPDNSNRRLYPVGSVGVLPVEAPVPFVPPDDDYIVALWMRQQEPYRYFAAVANGSVTFE